MYLIQILPGRVQGATEHDRIEQRFSYGRDNFYISYTISPAMSTGLHFVI